MTLITVSVGDSSSSSPSSGFVPTSPSSARSARRSVSPAGRKREGREGGRMRGRREEERREGGREGGRMRGRKRGGRERCTYAPMLCASSKTTTAFLVKLLETISAIFGSSR